jgi:Ca-activated chloride channel family protein
MSFQSPIALLALVAIPVLAALYWLAQQRRHAYAVRFTNLELLGQVVPRGPGIRRHLPTALFLLALTGLAFSFARPQATINVPGDRSNVMLVIDVSGSMQATDVQPTRLSAAVNAAQSLVDSLPPNASVGLVAFNSSAFVISPLSSDRDALRSGLQSLHARGGTAIGDGLNLALDQLGAPTSGPWSDQHPPSMIVLLTDGVSNAGAPPEEAAARAAEEHVPVNTVGVGSRGTQPVFVLGQDVGGVDEQALQSMAQTTGGRYFFATEAGQLQQIYSSLGSQFGWKHEKVDLTVPFAMAGALVLVAGAGLSLLWFRQLT